MKCKDRGHLSPIPSPVSLSSGSYDIYEYAVLPSFHRQGNRRSDSGIGKVRYKDGEDNDDDALLPSWTITLNLQC